MNLILLGAPGAGKGTQAEKLIALLGIPHLSTGNAFRAAIAAGTPLGLKVDPIMKAGQLVPDDLVIALVDERLTKPDCKGGALFDGYPRTLPQAEALEQSLAKLGQQVDHVVLIGVEQAVLFDRMAGRRTCPKCNAVFHLTSKPPKVQGRCDACGTELVVRPDQAPEKVQKRLDDYRAVTVALEPFYEKRGVLRRVDGMGSPEQVFERISHALETTGAKAAAPAVGQRPAARGPGEVSPKRAQRSAKKAQRPAKKAKRPAKKVKPAARRPAARRKKK